MAFGANKYDTSAFMAGNITVSVVFIESDGTIDQSTEDWTSAEISQVITYIENACNWWEDMWDAQGYVGDLNFSLDLTHAYTPFQSSYEPITRTVINEDKLWISEYLNTQGYLGSKNEMQYKYNNDLISDNNSDFAFTIYVVKADNDKDHRFADNYHAYTWGAFNGYSQTYVTLAYSDYYDYYTESPFAHEIGHIFGAADEYPGQGKYTDIEGYYGIQNTNATDGNPNPENIVISLMNNSIQQAYRQNTSSPQSLEMIGWRDSDNDGIIDVLDAPISISNFSSDLQVNNSQYTFSGTFTVDKIKNYNGTKAITINSVDRLAYRYGTDGEWIYVNTSDWGEESKKITYTFNLPSDSVLQWKVIDSDGTTESKTYTIGNISDLQNQTNHETASAEFRFTPATADTGIIRYNLCIDDQIYNIGNTDSYSIKVDYGNHQWKLQGVYSNSSTTDWIEGGSFTISPKVVSSSISGGINGGQWENVAGFEDYIVQYSRDNYKTVLNLSVSGNAISLYNTEEGQYEWRIGCPDSPEWSDGSSFSVSANTTIQRISAKEDDITDIFFANANGSWSADYEAQHTGILDGWQGTAEQVSLTGKNVIADVFKGSSDANILVMTDDTNGDALFVDDIYTALPGMVAEQQARIAQIDEIRAGAGDDIVDMTSQRFAYVGNGVKIYGGLGNDTIWANNGENTLFGDAGNDRLVGGADNDVIAGGIGNDSMHGGGGNDTFCFGENWGKDTVEQLANGKITLWFESGSENNWNADTLTYTDGTNSVKVSGISADKITLIFGDDASLRYDELVAAGCFDDAASEKIFEDKNKGILATM